MGFRINTNIAAMNAFRNSTSNNNYLDKSLNSLSSGLSINKSADNASGLSIANKLLTQAQGLGQSIRNSNDAIGLLQTASGAIDEQTNIAKRLRVLAVQAANDTQDADSRSYAELEFQALLSEYEDINNTTRFHSKNILDGSENAGVFTFHTGAYSGETQTVTLGANSFNDHFVLGGSIGGFPGIGTQAGAETTIQGIDSVLEGLHDRHSELGSSQNKLESNIRNISVTEVNVMSAESQLRDVDFASESATFAKRNIMSQSGSYALSQANAAQNNVMRLFS